MNYPSCEFCDKRGVPLLPLRYAIAPAGTSAPQAEGPAIGLPAQAAHYTRRPLRSGYLYVYDEARDRWESYFVTAQGYYLKFADTPGVVPLVPKKPFDCPDEGHRAVASCITIRDLRTAGKVWLGFSDVQWTDAVRAKHANAAYRQRHMRCVDVKAYAASLDAAHCFGIDEVGTKVAEYALEATALDKALGWGPFALDARKQRTARLLQECERLQRGKGFAVVLEDPAGLAAELGALMQRNLSLFVDATSRKRHLAASKVIEQIEAAVREQTLQAEEEAAESLANRAISQPDLGMLFSKRYRDEKVAQAEDMRRVMPAEAKRAGDAAWKRYTAKFDEPARQAWQVAFDKELAAYDGAFIAPLAVSHTQWMKSKAMADCFECNHDSSSADSGIVYAKTVQLCIGGTQDKGACFDLYHQWLQGDVRDKGNLILGALTLNLDKTREEIGRATEATADLHSLPWDALIDNFGIATQRVAGGVPDALGKVVASVGGPLARMLGEAVDGPMRHALVALGMVGGHPIVRVEVTGGKKAFRAMLIRELTRLSGTPMNRRQIERAVAAELRRLQVYGMKLEGTEKKRFLLMIDAEQAGKAPAGTTLSARAQWLASSIKTPEDVEALNLGRWRFDVSNPTGAAIAGSVPFVFGIVAALLQYKAYEKMSEDEDRAMAHEHQEARWRLRAGVAAIAGTISELVGIGLGKVAVVVPKFGQGLRSLASLMQWGGRALGLGGALVMAVWDYKQMVANDDEENFGVAWAYGTSVVFGSGVAVALAMGWTGIGVVLVALLMAVAVLIEYIKDNKMQDWLERCVWGKLERYPDAETEMRQLRLAVAG